MVGRAKGLFTLALSFSLILFILSSGCAKPLGTSPSAPAPGAAENQTQGYTAVSGPSQQMKVTLSLDGPPLLGKPVQVTSTFALQKWITSVAANTTARIVIPAGFELVSGKLEWQGDVLPGITYEITGTIKAIKTGDWQIEARAFYFPAKDTGRGGTSYLWALVYEDSATVSDHPTQPTETPSPKPTSPPTEIPPKSPAAPGGISPIPPHPSGGSSLPSGGATLSNPLAVTGGFFTQPSTKEASCNPFPPI